LLPIGTTKGVSNDRGAIPVHDIVESFLSVEIQRVTKKGNNVRAIRTHVDVFHAALPNDFVHILNR
jgi:hypothetical protein